MKKTPEFRVATMTFHMANNYGAMLQAYALQKTIETMGADCEILDYRLHHIYKRDGVYTWKEFMLDAGCIRGTARFFWRIIKGWYRNLLPARKKNDSFMRKDLRLSKKVFFQKEKLKKTCYDAVVFGSDQIWNPARTGGFAPEYLGEYFDSRKTVLIAYAASNGNDCIPSEYREAFVKSLRRFLAVGVREKSLAAYLTNECGIPAQTVLDPVLLADPAIWKPLADQGKLRIDEPYLLIYSFDAGEGIYKIAMRVAQERHLKPVAVCFKPIPQWDGIEQILTCGPKEFLYLLMHADFVCTTSFHGLAFSVLLEKNFYCMAHPEVGQRERDLIEMIGLQDRFFEQCGDLNMVTDCDFSEARKKLAKYREQSMAFLEDALKKAAALKAETQEQG